MYSIYYRKQSIILLPRTRQGIRQGIRLFTDFFESTVAPWHENPDTDPDDRRLTLKHLDVHKLSEGTVHTMCEESEKRKVKVPLPNFTMQGSSSRGDVNYLLPALCTALSAESDQTPL